VCGYGLHIDSLFAGCVLYADDIVLRPMSGSSTAYRIVNVCTEYGLE